MILLDTNVVSAFMRLASEPAVFRWLETLDESELHVPTLVVLEVQFGIECLPAGRKRRHLETQYDFVMTRMMKGRIVDFDRDAALATAEIYARPANRKQDTKIIDFQIAGVARAHKASLATHNTKDFVGLGVHLVDPWAM